MKSSTYANIVGALCIFGGIAFCLAGEPALAAAMFCSWAVLALIAAATGE